jgi:hypothetical protein
MLTKNILFMYKLFITDQCSMEGRKERKKERKKEGKKKER